MLFVFVPVSHQLSASFFFLTASSDEIACGICTYLNASYRHTCEMCGTSLKVTTADMD